MSDILGPLTTVFTPKPSCASHAGYTEFFNEDGGSYIVKGPVMTDGCYPPGFRPETNYYYTPGQCPAGYEGVAGRRTDYTETELCCPILETGGFGPATRGQSDNALPTSFPCVQQITNTTTVIPITQVSGGLTLSTVTSTITSAAIAAYGIQIAYTDGDNLEQPPDPERFNKVRLAYATQQLAHDHGLAPEARVGVGVGACLALGLIALGVILFVKRKRGPRQTEPANNRTMLSTRGTMMRIRRKPVPSVHSSELSVGKPAGDGGYSALSINEVQNDACAGVARDEGRRSKFIDAVLLWAWEILALLTSALSLASIIIVLDTYENRQLDEWTPKVSINAVISILSAIFKGSLAMPLSEGISQLKWLKFTRQPRPLSDLDLYDKASRGAWGSAMMIFGQFKSKSRAYLASFGAALVLIVLVTDPFAQATLSLYSCIKPGPEIASIPRANNYSAAFDSFSPMVPVSFNMSMQLAAYRGVLEPPANSSASVSVTCSTGNCTFPEDGGATFSTLTMCSQAWEISDRIQAKTGGLNGYIYSVSPQNSLDGYTLLNMSSVQVQDTSFQASAGDFWNRTSLIDVYIMSMLQDNSTDCKEPDCIRLKKFEAQFRPTAFVFSLFPCVQTLHAEMIEGQYSERVISEEYLHYTSRIGGSPFQLALNRTLINGTWEHCAAENKPTDTNTILVYLDPDTGNDPKLRTTWYSPECVFEFNAGQLLSSHLGETFFGRQTSSHMKPWSYRIWRNGTTDIDLITSFAKGLAISIGTQIRQGATGPSMLREARGTTLVQKTCIRIHWGYITFFAVLFIFELLFLGTIIVMSHYSKLRADWKSSTLAVAFLSAGASGRGGWPADRPESEDGLREASQSIQASLNDDSGHWKLQTEGPKF